MTEPEAASPDKRPPAMRVTSFQNGVITWTLQEYIDDVGPDVAARHTLEGARWRKPERPEDNGFVTYQNGKILKEG